MNKRKPIKVRNSQGKFASKGINEIYRILIATAIGSLGMYAFFGFNADIQAQTWHNNEVMNTSYSQNAPLSMTVRQLDQLQNKNASLR